MDSLETSSYCCYHIFWQYFSHCILCHCFCSCHKRPPDKPGYELPTAIMAGGQMLAGLWDANQLGSWYALHSTRSMVWRVAKQISALWNGNFTPERSILTIAFVLCSGWGRWDLSFWHVFPYGSILPSTWLFLIVSTMRPVMPVMVRMLGACIHGQA